MKSPNLLILKSANRNATFAMDGEGSIWSRKWPLEPPQTHDEVVINIEAKLPALSGGSEYDCNPVIILSWLEETFRFDDLLHRTIEIPKSYDESIKDHVTNFYYFQHLDFDDVRIHFVARDGERYRIKVTGTVPHQTSVGELDIEIDTVVRLTDR